MWFRIPMDHCRGRCATEDCLNVSEWKLEAEGVGADYCANCKFKIERQRISGFDQHIDNLDG